MTSTPMKTFAAATLCAVAGLLAVTGPAQAAPKLKLQKFAVKFEGEHGQDWIVQPTDDEFEPNCILGPGAYGSSELHTYTTGTEIVKVAADSKAGVLTGRAPLEAFLSHELTLGSLPRTTAATSTTSGCSRSRTAARSRSGASRTRGDPPPSTSASPAARSASRSSSPRRTT